MKNQDRNRKKILEAIVFFSQKGKIKYPSKMMIYKLLAAMDFRHFKETGMPITDLTYKAYPWGPVPEKLQNEMTKKEELQLPEDFQEALVVEKIKYDKDGEERIIFNYKARRKPNLEIFSPRQQRIMEEVAEIYKETKPTDASKASHEFDQPWTKTKSKKGVYAEIDFIDVIEVQGLSPEYLKEMKREREALNYNYGA